jgi:hypothetical protein
VVRAAAAMRHVSHRAELRADALAAQLLCDIKPILAMLNQAATGHGRLSTSCG